MSIFDININNEPLLLPEELQSSSADADNAGLLLISCACQLYRERFNTNLVPFSFIEFYLEEMSHYIDTFDESVKQFFNNHKKTNNLDLYIRMYTMSGYNTAKGIKTIDGYQYLILDPKNNFYIQDFIEHPKSYTELNIAKQLQEKLNTYTNSDELKSISELYDDYLIEKFIENYNNVKHQHSPTKSKEEIQSEILDTTHIGEKNVLPKQKGRVVKLNIPRFKLPMSYPIDLNNSRVLSEYSVKRFAYADKCIKLINKHSITAIGLSIGFIEKRKSVKKKKKFDKFDFDF